uniref:Uncharacterized protein n=1 Tax=Arundo donax TaxID=35708 RepID=A0A0A9QPT7_ARUDO
MARLLQELVEGGMFLSARCAWVGFGCSLVWGCGVPRCRG